MRWKEPSRLPSSTKMISYERPRRSSASVSSRWRTPRLSTSSRTGRITETSILVTLGVLPRSRCCNAYGQSVTVAVKSTLPLAAVYVGCVPHCHVGAGVTRASTAPTAPGKMPLFLP